MSDNYSMPKSSSRPMSPSMPAKSSASGDYCIPKGPPSGHKTGCAAPKRAPAQKTSRAADHSAPKHK